jgi:hypothetical protein
LIEPLFLNIGADPIDINDIQETVFDILVDCVGSHFRSPSESALLAITASYVRPSIWRSASNLLTTVGATA